MKHYLFFSFLFFSFFFFCIYKPTSAFLYSFLQILLYIDAMYHVPRGFGDIPISFLPCPWFTVALLLFYCIMFGSFFGIPCLNTTMDDTSSWVAPTFPFNRDSLA